MPDNLQTQAIRGAAWASAGGWVSQGITSVVAVVLARLLAPADFGLVALALVYVTLAQTLIDPGFTQAIIQREDLEPGHLDTAFWSSLGISLVFVLLSALLAVPIAVLLGEPALSGIVLWLSPVLLLGGLSSAQLALLSRRFQYRAIALREMGGAAVGGAVGIVCAFSGFGLWSLVAQQLTSALISAALIWVASDWRPGSAVTRRHLRDLYSFGIHLVHVKLLTFLNQRFDQILIGLTLGVGPLGIYSVARRIFDAMNAVLVRGPSQVALPAFSRVQGDLPRLREAYYRAVELLSVNTVPVYAIVAVHASLLAGLVLGDRWAGSGTILSCFCIAGLVSGVGHFATPVLLSQNEGQSAARLNVINTGANVLAFVLGLPWGLVGVSAGFAGRALLFQLVACRFLDRHFGISSRLLLGRVGAVLVSTVIAAAITIGLQQYGEDAANRYLLCAGGIALMASVYVGVLYLLNEKLVKELTWVALGLLRRGIS